jgi:homoserine dehydrogenase
MIKRIKLGVFGFGCVGQGLHQVLAQTKGIHAEITKICIKHPKKDRSLPASYFTTNAEDIFNDPEIDVVVELIDDADRAFEIVSRALREGKAVVSANKKMIAENLEELYELQQKYGVPFLYEGSCCASIPIIRNLEEYYDNDLLESVSGIFNGSTNYILTQVFGADKSFAQALEEAQQKGFAESDPTLDLSGMDPAYKSVIILLHTFGIFVKQKDIFTQGIQYLNAFDIAFATKENKVIKLISRIGKNNGHVYAYCAPTFVAADSPMHQVNDEYNGLVLESNFSQNQLFVGKGAGSEPTGSAVVSDISALSYQYRYEYKKIQQANGTMFNNDLIVKVYLRFRPYASINLTRFLNISEKFSNAEGSYVIGEINLKDLAYYQKNDPANMNIIIIE